MKQLAALWLVLQLVSTVFGQCGPVQCYSGCTDARVPLDLIFIIDVSGSMGEEINGIITGLNKFATDLEAKSVIPWYTLIVFGNSDDKAEVLLNAESSSSSFKNKMSSIKVNGGWEPGLETIRRTLGKASTQNFAINLRSGSKRALVLLTDEDSDPAYSSANRYQSSGNDARDGNCGPNNMAQYQSEIDDTAKIIMGADFSTYLLVKVGTGSSTCLTSRQYGHYNLQVQSADFKTFDAAATLQKLIDFNLQYSIQGQMLSAGKYSRVFRVESLSDNTFVNNFFQSVTADVSACDNKCYLYKCSAQNTCLTPESICGCDGEPNSGRTLDAWGTCCLSSERDCSGKCFGTNRNDECGICVPSGTRSPSCLQDCAGKFYLVSTTPLNKRDECNICVSSTITRDPSCFQDCSGVWRTSSASAYFVDNCGICVAPGTNANANKDDCGVCFGKNVNKNQCGVCFGTTTLDNCGNPVCQGKTCVQNCDGKYEVTLTKSLDECSYCVALGTRSPNCLSDCAGKFYRTGTTSLNKYDECGICVSSSITRSPTCFQDCAKNWVTSTSQAYFTDSCNQCVAPGSNTNAFKDECGVCFGNNAAKNQCGTCFGSSALDNCGNPVCQGKTCGTNCAGESEVVLTKDLDECGYCVAIGTRSPLCLNDCAGKFYKTGAASPNKYDECGICVSSSVTRSPTCFQDCAGNWLTDSGKSHVYDNCGVCVAPGTNADANKDDCGVCFGKNANKNQCGTCFGTTSLDNCANPVCQGKTCVQNCDNQYEVSFSKGYDECGFCVLLGSRSPNCLTDCAGKFYRDNETPQNKRDECNVCVTSSIARSPDCKQDCSGVWNGTAYYDQCNQCIDGKDDFTCAQDCNGDYYRLGKDTPIHTFDSCNECNTAQDQNKLKDNCGICSNQPGYNSTAECTPDCKGIWTLLDDPSRSFVDFCGDCWFFNQNEFRNYRMDDCGICLATRDDPDWNKDRKVDSQGVKCACYVDFNKCLDLEEKLFDSCLDCPSLNPCPNGNFPDSCGHCPGKSMYGKRDKCEICCSPEDGIPCGIDVDDCGVCFGQNKLKEQNPCKICDASKCIVDCLGIPNGTAIVGCDGICNSNAKCSYCGNGIVDEGEACDLGNGKNIKGSGCFNCQAESGGSNNGSVIGGVIGGIAAIAFLAIAGFLAYQYAAKNGLIGKAGKNVDFNDSNNNPIYASNVQVASNPLYIN